MVTETMRAILFDWGGVLIDDPADGLVTYCAEQLALPKEIYTREYRKYLPDFQKGLIAEQDMWKRLCGHFRIPPPTPPSLYRRAVEHVFTERPMVFQLARTLHRKGYKVGFLSNTEIPAMEYFISRGYDFFDATVFSCAEHTAKPEPRIYRIACQRLGTEPHRAVFIDDRPDYLQGAVRVGMQTIRYRTLPQVAGELRSLGVHW
ncbi:MAG: HAD family phosphatase [Phycisphaerae bacterium]|nr:HAD family phosphatase [Phycisphaerae bacterium]